MRFIDLDDEYIIYRAFIAFKMTPPFIQYLLKYKSYGRNELLVLGKLHPRGTFIWEL